MAEVIGLITSVIAIIETISKAYDTVERIKNIPEAFNEVGGELPLAKETLKKAKQRLIKEVLDESADLKDAVRKRIKQCEENLLEIQKIFETIRDKAKPDGDASERAKGKLKEWTDDLARIYQNIALVAGGKDKRVEQLFKRVVEGLQALTNLAVFKPEFRPTERETLQTMLKALAEVAPSAKGETGSGMNQEAYGNENKMIQSSNTGSGKTVNAAQVDKGGIVNNENKDQATQNFNYGG